MSQKLVKLLYFSQNIPIFFSYLPFGSIACITVQRSYLFIFFLKIIIVIKHIKMTLKRNYN